MTQIQSQPGIMAQLKEGTAELHGHAESRPLQRAMAKGTLSREQFVSYLEQMWVVHGALEAALRAARPTNAAIAAVQHDRHFREPNLQADLAFFGAEMQDIHSSAATAEMVRRIREAAQHAPVALLGMLYVLEGSTNGSKFIARSMGRALGLGPGPGLSYLDPYGQLQTECWQQFKRDMDAVGFTAQQEAQIIAAAKAMFEGISAISDELMEPAAV